MVVSPDGGGFAGPTDQALAARGASRRVVLSVPDFMSALLAVTRTDLVAMLPSRLAAARGDVCVRRPPLEVPGFDMALVWHERSQRDPAQRWLREQLAAAAIDAPAPRSRASD